MVSVVCQVSERPDGWSLTWSEGQAAFPPYTIQGSALAELRRMAGQAREQLASFAASAGDGPPNPKTGHQLAQIGHILFRLLFGLDQPAPHVGHEVQGWLDRLTSEQRVDELQIVGDALLLPWSIVYGRAPEQSAFAHGGTGEGDAWSGFWARRYQLVCRRRVHWPLSDGWDEKPSVVFAVDPAVKSALPAEEQQRLQDFAARHGAPVADSVERLGKIFQSQNVDLLYVLARAEGDAVRLGETLLTAAALEQMALASKDDGELGLRPVVLVSAYAGGSAGNLPGAFERFACAGLVGSWAPPAASIANRAGLAVLEEFLKGAANLAAAAAKAWRGDPAAALLYFAIAPGTLRAGKIPVHADEGEPLDLPDLPYQPLVSLVEDDVPILVGREFDIAEVGRLLDDSAVRMVLLHGEPGAGKASLLRAGVAPLLDHEAIGYRMLRDRADEEPPTEERECPLLPIRATSDLAGQLAGALFTFCARPYSYATPAGDAVTVDLPKLLDQAVSCELGGDEQATVEDLRVALAEGPEVLGRILVSLTAQLPFELVLAIENAEELFALAPPDEDANEALEALAMLRAAMKSPARVKFMVSLRTESVGRVLDGLVQSPEDAHLVRAFFVNQLAQNDLVEVILQPTSPDPLPGTDEAPLARYGIVFEQGLAETIAADALKLGGQNQESPLVLVHVICNRLYELVRGRPEKVVRAADLKAVGGVAKGLAKNLQTQLSRAAAGADRKALNDLLLKLYIRQPDGSVTRDLLFEEDLIPKWRGSKPLADVVDRAAADPIRLLDRPYLNIGGKEGRYVSLAHDALAPVAAQLAEETTKRKAWWTGTFDALWIAVPLIILAVVFLWTRLSAAWREKESLDTQVTKITGEFQLQQERAAGTYWPAYTAQTQAAEKAMLAGDFLRARQALLSAQKEFREPDLRGFEWFYLLNQLQQDGTTYHGHRGTVTGVAIAPDGFTMATIGVDGAVRLWDPPTGRVVAKWDLKDKEATPAGRCVAISPDSGLLAAGADDGRVRLWKINRVDLDYPPNAAGFVATLGSTSMGFFSPLGQVATRVRSGESGEAAPELLDGHKGAVTALAFALDGKSLVSTGQDGTAKLWDITASPPKETATLKDHKGAVLCAAFSPDGKWLATGGADKVLFIWDGKSGTKKETLEGHVQSVAAVAWSPDGKRLVSVGGDGSAPVEMGVVKLWDTGSWKEEPLGLSVAPVLAVAFVKDGKALATAGRDNNVHIWDLANGKELGARQGHLGWVGALATARGGEMLATGSFDGTAKLWQSQTHESHDLLRVSKGPVLATAFSPDDKLLAASGADGTVKIFDVGRGEEIQSLQAGKAAVGALTWSAEGKTLITGAADGWLKLWDADPQSKGFGRPLDAIEAHSKDVTCLGVLEHKLRVVSGGLDGTVKIWKIVDGKFDKSPIVAKAESPTYCLTIVEGKDIELVFTGHEDAKVRIWDPATGQFFPQKRIPHPVLEGHTGPVLSITLIILHSQVGNQQVSQAVLITGSADRTIKFWEPVEGLEHGTVRGHAGPVTSLAAPPIAQPPHTIVSGGTDGTIKLWAPLDLKNFKDLFSSKDVVLKERWTFTPGISAVRSVAMTNTSAIIAVAGQDGTVRLYRAGKEK
jgi:WD40 repeat protein